MSMDNSAYHFNRREDSGNPDFRPRSTNRHYNRPTVSKTSLLQSKPSNGCTQCADIPSNQLWMKSFIAGNYIGWPLLTAENFKKYYPATDETPKGHMNQTRKNVGSIKEKPTPLETRNIEKLHGKKESNIYTRAYDVQETVFPEQTGQFPTKSRQGNKYIMVMVKINSNTILI